jgi:hypothetical protein
MLIQKWAESIKNVQANDHYAGFETGTREYF